MRKEKEIVRRYYDNFGWVNNGAGLYNETETWFDMSPATYPYQHQCVIRTKHFLKPSGMYFLDAGSGAIQHPEHLEYSASYRWHVCVDISTRALVEARSKLRGRGLYVLADVASLPFKEEVFDGAICSELLFHVPGDEQEVAVRELHRVIRHGSNCVIIYQWRTCLLTAIAEMVNRTTLFTMRTIGGIPGIRYVKELVRLRFRGQVPVSNSRGAYPPLYFHAHSYRWFRRTFQRHWDIEIRPFRSVDEKFMRALIPHNWMGRLFLNLVFWLETLLPNLFTRIGQYPMIIINKR